MGKVQAGGGGGGKSYLVAVHYRLEGFGEPGKYSGVSANVDVHWQDAAGKDLGGAAALAFPYHAVDWDLADQFVLAPPGAAWLILTAGINNASEKEIGRNTPSTIWLDGCQVREYTRPPTPDSAKEQVPRMVMEAPSIAPHGSAYQLSSQNYAGGEWSTITPDAEATYDSVITSPEGVGRGVMAHSPACAYPGPGLYRAVLRCKVSDNTGDQEVGSLVIRSQRAGERAVLHLFPQDFAAANEFQEFEVDFILRGEGYWEFSLWTEGNQPFTADIVKVFPLLLLEDEALADLYAGK